MRTLLDGSKCFSPARYFSALKVGRGNTPRLLSNTPRHFELPSGQLAKNNPASNPLSEWNTDNTEWTDLHRSLALDPHLPYVIKSVIICMLFMLLIKSSGYYLLQIILLEHPPPRQKNIPFQACILIPVTIMADNLCH